VVGGRRVRTTNGLGSTKLFPVRTYQPADEAGTSARNTFLGADIEEAHLVPQGQGCALEEGTSCLLPSLPASLLHSSRLSDIMFLFFLPLLDRSIKH